MKNVKNDLLSGLTVALALVPEAIAFAFVCHISRARISTFGFLILIDIIPPVYTNI